MYMEDPPDWAVGGGNEGPPGWEDFIREVDRRWEETGEAPDHGEPEPPDHEPKPGRPKPQWKPVVRYTAVWRQGTHAEIQAYGWPYADYRRAYDNPLWGNGYRLTHLTPYTHGTETFYTAVWRTGQSPGEIQVYGWTYEDYRKKYDELWQQGWRLKILAPHRVASDRRYVTRYTAAWKQSTQGEIQLYERPYSEYRAKYDELWNQGWRLKDLSIYHDTDARYTAVWQPSTEAEIQLYDVPYAEYRKKYDELWPQGWRLKLLVPYNAFTSVRYTAVWRRSTSAEIQLYDVPYEEYRKKYDELWNQGWRLKLLAPYKTWTKVR